MSIRTALSALAVTLALVASSPAQPADPAKPIVPTWPPKGTAMKVPVSRDLWVSAMGEEAIGSNGGASQLKLKGQQEYSIIDIDPAPLKGKIITGALLHFRCNSPNEPVKRLTVSSLASDWVEGDSSSYKPQEGSGCFNQAKYKQADWAYPGGNLLDVAWGRGNTIWRFAEATPPDDKGWQAAAVWADVIAARAAGLSYGLALYDDVGSEWSLKGGKFTFMHFPNRFIASREQNNAAPYLEVWTDGQDAQPPAAVSDVRSTAAGLPPGQAIVAWKAPADTGGGRTLGFNVSYKAAAGEQPVPRHLIPMAGAAGDEVKMLLWNLPAKPGEKLALSIKAVDSCGNVGPAVEHEATLSAQAPLAPKPSGIEPFAPSEKLPEVGGLKVAVVDMLDKIHPQTGKMIPDHPAGYLGGNHLWSGDKKLVRLHAARNEAVAFQVNLQGQSEEVEVVFAFADVEGVMPRTYALDYTGTGAGPMPDACIALPKTFSIPAKDDPQAKDQKNTSFLCEVYVPHQAKPGAKKGFITISSGGKDLHIAVELTVWDFTLPNKLSFVPEMNAYGTAGPSGQGLEYYRVAHEHRCCINRLYYNWNGAVQGGAAPSWDGQTLGFDQWDKSFAPMLDGTAFADLPRKGEPVDVFYLPFNEHWPMDVYADYTKSYWADEAFAPKYAQGLKAAFAQFAKHCDQKKWHDTGFEFFLNGKVYNKTEGWKRTSAPWIFDEPANVQDFWALRWYGLLWRQGVDPVRGQARMWYRADVSRSNYDRDMFFNVMDVEVLGGASPQKIRFKQEERSAVAPCWWTEYGGANDPAQPNIQPVVWCLKAWANGSVGVLPWQTIATPGAWNKGEDTGVLYPGPGNKVSPSLRLKAFRQGQQDVEYLTLLAKTYGVPPSAVAEGMEQVVSLAGKVIKRSEEDAGIIVFQKADPQALWTLRTSVGKMLDEKKPAYERCIFPLTTPAYDLKKLPPVGYVPVGPKVPSATPVMQE